MKPEDFYTRGACNNGTLFHLKTKKGQDTGHTFTVLGDDSDAYIAAEAKMMRGASKLLRKIKDSEGEEKEAAEKLYEEYTKDATVNLLTEIVVDWSLDKEFTKEAVREMLREAPYIQDKLNNFFSDIGNFLKAQSES